MASQAEIRLEWADVPFAVLTVSNIETLLQKFIAKQLTDPNYNVCQMMKIIQKMLVGRFGENAFFSSELQQMAFEIVGVLVKLCGLTWNPLSSWSAVHSDRSSDRYYYKDIKNVLDQYDDNVDISIHIGLVFPNIDEDLLNSIESTFRSSEISRIAKEFRDNSGESERNEQEALVKELVLAMVHHVIIYIDCNMASATDCAILPEDIRSRLENIRKHRNEVVHGLKSYHFTNDSVRDDYISNYKACVKHFGQLVTVEDNMMELPRNYQNLRHCIDLLNTDIAKETGDGEPLSDTLKRWIQEKKVLEKDLQSLLDDVSKALKYVTTETNRSKKKIKKFRQEHLSKNVDFIDEGGHVNLLLKEVLDIQINIQTRVSEIRILGLPQTTDDRSDEDDESERDDESDDGVRKGYQSQQEQRI